MCFVLYAASNLAMPEIAWNESSPAFHSTRIGLCESIVGKHFTKIQRCYIGSHQGCGCGFRHLTFQRDGWPEEELIGTDYFQSLQSDQSSYDANHQKLRDYVEPLLEHNATVELYGCWSGEEDSLPESRQDIRLSHLVSQEFYFRERGLYTVYTND